MYMYVTFVSYGSSTNVFFLDKVNYQVAYEISLLTNAFKILLL